jgi:glycosyltransferase involved in cell wall biosynthesis
MIELKELAASADGRVTFTGLVTGSEKDRLLRESDFLLFPPREPEGHPRVVLEAIAAGMPVVTTAQGAIPETVEDGVSGFVHEKPDPDALAGSMTKILTDDRLRLTMSEAARDSFLARFTQEHADLALADWLSSLSLDPR